MRFRFATALAAIALVAAFSPPTQARAADDVVAHDTKIRFVYPLGGDLVYYRPPLVTREDDPQRAWMAEFGGRVRSARGIPPEAYPGDIGLDRKGRKVFTFNVPRKRGAALVSSK